jgi:hypothetical protein
LSKKQLSPQKDNTASRASLSPQKKDFIPGNPLQGQSATLAMKQIK